MRPAGEIRQALRDAVRELHGVQGSASLLDLAPRVPRLNPAAPSEMELVRRTLVNMADAGELQRVGKHKPPGSARWFTLYEPAEPAEPEAAAAVLPPEPPAQAGLDALGEALSLWRALPTD